jgi:D-xylose 1-dehydrogenase (NADP+, D-xylono-1,5-lactone-forming)
VAGLRLGLLATARINAKLVPGAKAADGVEVVALGGRSKERAQEQARALGIPRALGSYEALLADPDVDAVYIALPNALHAEWTLRALEAGKHVLCEKPFTTDPAVAERCFDAAASRGLVLTEGFMWRHGDQAKQVSALVRQGAIGELRSVRASFAFVLTRDEDVRWIADLGGGSLLDVGTYCVSAARMLAGEPTEAHAVARLAPAGADAHFAATMRHGGDVVSLFECGFDFADQGLAVFGSEGSLHVADPWHVTKPGIELRRVGNGDPQRMTLPWRNQYALEVEDFAAAIRDGREPLVGRAEVAGQARALQMLREAAGIGALAAAA